MKTLLPAVILLCVLINSIHSASAQTWSQATNAPIAAWNAIASSADGTKLVAGTYAGSIYTSADSGATWTTNAISNMIWDYLVHKPK
jgi:photosystem II stability/assembly factor-like uncharacterized protein